MPEATKLTGLSISFCIKDIMLGKITEGEVEKVIGGTSVRTSEQWEELIELYRRIYWRAFPDKAEALFRKMLAEGRIDQGEHNIGKGYWLRDGEPVRL